MSPPFKIPCIIQISGGTGSGKTTGLGEILKFKENFVVQHETNEGSKLNRDKTWYTILIVGGTVNKPWNSEKWREMANLNCKRGESGLYTHRTPHLDQITLEYIFQLIQRPRIFEKNESPLLRVDEETPLEKLNKLSGKKTPMTIRETLDQNVNHTQLDESSATEIGRVFGKTRVKPNINEDDNIILTTPCITNSEIENIDGYREPFLLVLDDCEINRERGSNSREINSKLLRLCSMTSHHFNVTIIVVRHSAHGSEQGTLAHNSSYFLIPTHSGNNFSLCNRFLSTRLQSDKTNQRAKLMKKIERVNKKIGAKILVVDLNEENTPLYIRGFLKETTKLFIHPLENPPIIKVDLNPPTTAAPTDSEPTSTFVSASSSLPSNTLEEDSLPPLPPNSPSPPPPNSSSSPPPLKRNKYLL